MTIREFFESAEKLAIHCDSKGKAKTLLKAFDREGYTWWNRDKYIDDTYWYIEEGETCYDNDCEYATREFYQRMGYKIIEFEDIELHPKYIKVIQECIRLLSVDGSNTKQQVKEMLERLVDDDHNNN